ncbi:MAG: alpha/beta hydrolase-fold protein, partial [candidate division KSB1 bacterium]|nr:alpha/beta hydrolase-fold protein [candidate division KSB1 bacterium]
MNPVTKLLQISMLLLAAQSLMPMGKERADFCEKRVGLFSSFSTGPILLDDTTAVFVYRGAAESVSLAGDWNGWQPHKMTFDPTLGIWYAVLVFPANARLDYKFVLNEAEWILDPANPSICRGGFGDNSELVMPHYKHSEETIPRSDIPTGMIVDSTWYSYSLQKRRAVQLYFPAAYEHLAGDLPLVLFLDGKDFLDAGSAKIILDNLIASGRIPPLIALFDSPFDRISEYAGPSVDALDAYITSELLPKLANITKVSKNPAQRAIIGVSLSAVFASRFVQRHPDQFGCCAAFSPAYWYD